MSRDCSLPLLITSAINASAPMTRLTDLRRRLELTVLALDHWLANSAASSITVCDGTDFDWSALRYKYPSVEFLTFQNDVAAVQAYGKGYGEGEIVAYALAKSANLARSTQFMKCTSKLWVKNTLQCIGAFNGIGGFDYQGLFSVKRVDTRFYMVSKEFYCRNLLSAHHMVRDLAGYYLEHAFRDALSREPVYKYLVRIPPVVCGISGSMDSNYAYSPIKHSLRSLRSHVMTRRYFKSDR